MIKVEVIENFTLERFNELKNIERKGQDVKGKLNVGDRFECEKELADYLLGNNPLKKAVVKVIEIKPIVKELAQFGNEAKAEKLLKAKATKKKSKK